ncbi:MAG: hypothetical protein ACRERZ_03915, partial [Gammaproteobacteria bacterium]
MTKENLLQLKIRDIANAAAFIRTRDNALEKAIEKNDIITIDRLHSATARFLVKNISHNLVIMIRALYDADSTDRNTLIKYAKETNSND